jgi:hypothetical protein
MLSANKFKRSWLVTDTSRPSVIQLDQLYMHQKTGSTSLFVRMRIIKALTVLLLNIQLYLLGHLIQSAGSVAQHFCDSLLNHFCMIKNKFLYLMKQKW